MRGLELRDYQRAVVTEALERNTLAILPTGSGKTLIATHIITERLKRIRELHRSDNDLKGKLIAFIAPTKVLVGQQQKYLSVHVMLENVKVIPFAGNTSSINGKSVQYLNNHGWQDQLKEIDVLVMTPQILKQMLQKKLFIMEYFDSIIIDECHHAIGDHPLTSICAAVKSSDFPPFIFAMTASPVMCKKRSIEENLTALEDILGCRTFCTKEILEQYKNLIPSAELSMFRYEEQNFKVVDRYIAPQAQDPLSLQFSELEFDLKTNFTKLMLSAFFRAKCASLTSTLYTLLVNMRADPEQLGIVDKSFPSVECFRNYRKTGCLDGAYAISLNPTIHVFRYNSKIKFGGNGAQLVQSLGQILNICEDSGTIAGLYAFLVCIGNSRKAAVARAPKFAQTSLRRNSLGFRDQAKRTLHHGKRVFPAIELFSTGGITDMDRVNAIADDLKRSPFPIIDLVHEDYAFCATLFDFTLGFAVSLGREVCFYAQKKFLQLQRRSEPSHYTCRIKLNTPAAQEVAKSGSLEISLTIVHAMMYVLLQCAVDDRVVKIAGVEGCLNLVATHWNDYVESDEESVKLSEFEIREKECYNTILCIGWCLLSNIAVAELQLWTSIFEDSISSMLEPLTVGSDEVFPPSKNVEPCGNLRPFIPVTVKVQALSKIWVILNSEESVEDHDNAVNDEVKKINQTKDDVVAIIFCKMRLHALALHFVISLLLENLHSLNLPADNEADTISMEVQSLMEEIVDIVCGERRPKVKFSCRDGAVKTPMFRAAHLVGNSSQDRQLEVLRLFKDGVYNVVFATDVMEEGLDVKACKYVINFDPPTCIKSFVQRKGRSRSENSQMIFFIPFGEEGNSVLSEVMQLQNQEKEIENRTNCANRSSQCLEMEVCNMFEQSIVYCQSEYARVETTNTILQFEGSSDLMNDFISSSTTKMIENHDARSCIEKDRFIVVSTGTEVDGKMATQLLQRFCRQLPHDSFYNPQPIYWITNYSTSTGPLYSCSILLPPHIEPKIRFIVGAYAQNKAAAKGFASLESIKLLHENGHFNDFLIPFGSKGSMNGRTASATANGVRKRRKLSQQIGEDLKLKSHEEHLFEEDVEADGDFQLNAENKELIKISSKYVPDLMRISSSLNCPTESTTPLYFYVVQTCFSDERSAEVVMNCLSCRHYYEGLNSFGIVLGSQISEEVLQESFSGSIRNSEKIDISIKFLGCRSVSEAELIQMQRFHKAVVCWESENVLLGDEADHYNWLDGSNARVHLWPNTGSRYPIPPDEWASSSNGAWYIIFPLPDIQISVNLNVNCSAKATACVEKLRLLSTFTNQDEWMSFLLRTADEAQILVHNLMVQEKINQGINSCYFLRFCEKKMTQNVEGMLLSRGFGSIYVCCNCNAGKKLNNVAKFVPKEQINLEIKNNVTAITEDMVSSVCEYAVKIEGNQTTMQIYQKVQSDPIIPLLSEPAADSGGNNQKLNSQSNKDMVPMTYLQIFMKKHPHYIKELGAVAGKKEHQLISAVPMIGKLTLYCLFSTAGRNPSQNQCFNKVHLPRQEKKRSFHTHANIINLVPELCQVIGPCKWYAVGLVLPSVVWKLQSLLLAEEVRSIILQSVVAYDKSQGGNARVQLTARDRFTEEGMSGSESFVKSDGKFLNIPFQIPTISIMLEAMTPRLAREPIDSERLEMLGDSLLKLVTSVEVYRLFPTKHEGFLTFERAKFINNLFLLERACKLGLHHYVRAIPLSTGKQELTIMPSGMNFEAFTKGVSLWNHCITPNMKKPLHVTEENENSNDDAKHSGGVKASFKDFYPVKQHQYVEVKPKVLADVMESIFGAFYICGGISAGIAAIKAFGVWPTFSDHKFNTAKEVATDESLDLKDKDIQEILATSNDAEEIILPSIDKTIEIKENYQFRVKYSTFADQYEFPPNYPEVLKRIVHGLKENLMDLQPHTISNDAMMEDDEESNDFTVIQLQNNFSINYLQANQNQKFGMLKLPKQEIIDEIAAILNYRFINWAILEEALTHCSCEDVYSNQRLEFLGDAVLDFAVVSLLYRQNHGQPLVIFRVKRVVSLVIII